MAVFFDNPQAIQALWYRQYKPAADRWPMIITEMFWTPMPNDQWNLVNGTTNGFGNAIKNAIDNQGNVSYVVGFLSDLIEDLRECRPGACELSPREGAQAYFDWQPSFAESVPKCWGDAAGAPDRSIMIANNYPNPFTDETLINFDLREASTVTVSIYTIQGAKVRTLMRGSLEAGRHGIRLEAHDDGGNLLSSGVYLVRIEASSGSKSQQDSRKIVLVR